jgi:hypothetical protein
MEAQPLSVRLPQSLRKELERAALADARPVSGLVRKILADWLKQHAVPRDR